MRSVENPALPSRFEIQRCLGRGGMADVWLAYDSQTARPVAIKCARDDAGAAALQREAGLLRRLPSLVSARVMAASDGDPPISDSCWLALEYLERGDLRHIGDLPLGDRVDLLLQVAHGLRNVHTAGFVHGDVKASNVLRAQDGSARLIDFGVACAIGHGSGERVWRGGSLCSASPAQVWGEPAAIADDVYGFGALAYELLGGTPPLGPAPTPEAVCEQLPESLVALNPELPEPLAWAVDRMLAKSPEERPQDFASVIELLEPWVANGALAAGSDSAAPPGAEEEPTAAPAVLAAEAFTPTVSAVRPVPVAAATPGQRSSSLRSQPKGRAAFVGLLPAIVGLVGLMLGAAALLYVVGVAEVDEPPSAAAARSAQSRELRANGARARMDPPAASGASGLVASALPDPVALDPKQREQDRVEAQAALGRWASLRAPLEERGASFWGARDWTQAEEAGAEGDAFFQAADYARAAERYRDAQARLIELRQREPGILSRALASGEAALEAGERDEALRQFEIALRIDPAEARARVGRERALKLDQTLDRIRRALTAERDGDLRAAREGFEQALAMDAAAEPASQGLARVTKQLDDQRYEQLLSQGYAALDRGELDLARQSFQQAQSLRPESSAVRDGLAQLQGADELRRIKQLRVRAEQSERDERWQDAISAYEAALAVDSGLSFAAEGLERSRGLLDLARRIEQLVSSPGRLLALEVRQQASSWLAEVSALETPPPGLRGQAARLEELLALARRPVPVVFESDNQTRVVLLRVGPLGTFERRETQLEPGRYTVVGIREGYRDVRESFLVVPGKPVRVAVRAEEAI